MAYEIERKFLVRSDEWRAVADQGSSIRQGYLATGGALSVRARIRDGRRATLTIKSRKAGLRRHEFEYDIPVEDADTLITLCSGAVIEKVRYRVRQGELTWELDVFRGENEGLIIAEIELQHEEQPFERPRWIGDEITSVERYYNASLVKHPFSRWQGERDAPPPAAGTGAQRKGA